MGGTAYEAILKNLAATQQYNTQSARYKANAIVGVANANAAGMIAAAKLAAAGQTGAAEMQASVNYGKAINSLGMAKFYNQLAAQAGTQQTKDLSLAVMNQITPVAAQTPPQQSHPELHHGTINAAKSAIGDALGINKPHQSFLNKAAHIGLTAISPAEIVAHKLRDEWQGSSPGKKVLDALQRPVQGSGSAINYLKNGKDRSLGGTLKAWWEGISDKSHILPSGVINPIPKSKNPILKFLGGVTGTAEDIALDPTTYIPVGGAAKIGMKVSRPLEEAEIKGAAREAIADKSKPIVDPKKSGASGTLMSPAKDFLQNKYQPIPEAVGKEVELFKAPRFAATGEGTVSDATNPVNFANTLVGDKIAGAVQNAPQLVYPHLNLESPFKPVTVSETTRVAKTIPQDITVTRPNPKFNAKTPPVAVSTSTATKSIHAIRMMLTNNPDHIMATIKGKGATRITVGDLLDTASKSTPARQADIKNLLQKEAVHLYKTKAVDKIPDEITFTGRSGKPIPIKLSKDQALSLFTEGKVPAVLKNYSEDTDAFTGKFPLHSVEDLKTAHVKDETGKQIPLHQYLKDNNIPIQTVDQAGNTKSVIKGSEDDTPFNLSPEEPATIQQTVRTNKTIYENVNKVSTSMQRVKGAEAVAWLTKNTSDMSIKDALYVRNAKTAQEFDKRVVEMRTKSVVGNVKSLDQFIAAAKEGSIPDEYVAKVLKDAGVKSLDELKSVAQKIIKKTGETSTPKVEDFSATGKVTRTSKKIDSIWDGVATPAEIIEKVSAGDTNLLAKPRPNVTPQIAQDVDRAIQVAFKKNIKIPSTDAYNFKSKSGTLRTSNILREGVGRNLKGWNSFSQGDALRSLVTSASNRLRAVSETLKSPGAKRQFWKERSENMYNAIMPALQVLENELATHGVKIIAGHDEAGILMSINDVLTSLPKEFVKKHLFVPPGGRVPSIKPTGISNAAEPLVTAVLNHGNMDIAREASYQALMDKTTGGSFYGFGEKGQLAARSVVAELEKALPTLLQKVNKNYAEQSIKVGQSVTSMTDQVVNSILNGLHDPAVPAVDTLSDLMDRSKELVKVGNKIGAPSDATPIAKVMADQTLVKNGVEPGDLAEAATSKAVAGSKNKSDMLKNGLSQQKSRVAEANTLAGSPIVDVDDYFNLRTEAGLLRSYVPVAAKVGALGELAGRALRSDYGYPSLHDSLWGTRNSNAAIARAHRSLMSKISKYAADTYGTDARKAEQESFKNLQQPGAVPTNPLQVAMKDSLDLMFNPGKNSEASLAIRNGLFTEHLNKMLDYYKVPKGIRFDPEKPLAEQSEVWRSWDNVEDPLDALDRTFAAYQFALTDSTVGRVFSSEFGVAKPRPGFVSITDKGGRSTLHKFIDTSLYYPKEIASEIPYYDEARNVSEHGIKGKNAAYVVSLYDKAIFGVKTGLTVLRPGHHVSNLMGDVILNMLAGTTSPLAYRRSLRILSGRASNYRDWDGIKALRNDEAAQGVLPGKTLKVAKKFSMTDDEIWRAAHKQGLLSDYHMIQDLEYNDTQQFQKLHQAVGPVKNAGRAVVGMAGKTADVISHHMRMAQFVDVLGKSKAKTLQDAIDEAGRAVRKWHPDGTDLTPFERKYAKRVILFYAWMRKSTPLILQSLLTRPGRALVIPKASYNFSEVMGVNPDSLSDPFPQGMLLPSFISDAVLGPQWKANKGMLPQLGGELPHEFGVTLPGDPVTQTVDQQVNNPIKTLLGGLSPVLKVPIEEATKTNLGTGSPITKQSEYIDNQLPLVSNIANILNRSVTGGLAPQHDVTSGNSPGGIDKAALANFLTGVGVKDYSKLSYKKEGLYELRQKYLKQALNGGK